MVLGFKTHLPNGKPTGFKSKILAGVDSSIELIPKIHTIREGERWKPGMKIHMATGVRTPKYEQFNKEYPELQTVIHTQKIVIKNQFDDQAGVWIDDIKLGDREIIKLAMNDGFNSPTEFWRWFIWQDFYGQIIHWTNFKYS